jgi:hypothetical protein
MITAIEAPFITTLVHIVVGMRSRPQTPKGTKLVSVHEEMP